MTIDDLKIGEVYEIRYNGPYEYTNYSGKGTYTGEVEEYENGILDPGFSISAQLGTAYFPINDVFKIN